MERLFFLATFVEHLGTVAIHQFFDPLVRWCLWAILAQNSKLSFLKNRPAHKYRLKSRFSLSIHPIKSILSSREMKDENRRYSCIWQTQMSFGCQDMCTLAFRDVTSKLLCRITTASYTTLRIARTTSTQEPSRWQLGKIRPSHLLHAFRAKK